MVHKEGEKKIRLQIVCKLNAEEEQLELFHCRERCWDTGTAVWARVPSQILSMCMFQKHLIENCSLETAAFCAACSVKEYERI